MGDGASSVAYAPESVRETPDMEPPLTLPSAAGRGDGGRGDSPSDAPSDDASPLTPSRTNESS